MAEAHCWCCKTPLVWVSGRWLACNGDNVCTGGGLNGKHESDTTILPAEIFDRLLEDD